MPGGGGVPNGGWMPPLLLSLRLLPPADPDRRLVLPISIGWFGWSTAARQHRASTETWTGMADSGRTTSFVPSSCPSASALSQLERRVYRSATVRERTLADR